VVDVARLWKDRHGSALGATALFAVVALSAALAVTGWPGRAWGEGRTAWLVVEGGLAVNGVTDHGHLDAIDVRVEPLVGLSAAALVRPLPYLSAGLLLHYGLLYPHSEDVTPGAAGFFLLAAGARAHYAFGRFEPWIGAGIGYASTHASATGSRAADSGTLTLHAMALDLSAGLHVAVTDRITIGPYLRFVFGLWATGCQDFESWPFEVGEEECENIESLYGHELPRLPHLWVAGGQVAFSAL
jgi:hypothetical protein